jgi:hypothetical protein
MLFPVFVAEELATIGLNGNRSLVSSMKMANSLTYGKRRFSLR